MRAYVASPMVWVMCFWREMPREEMSSHVKLSSAKRRRGRLKTSTQMIRFEVEDGTARSVVFGDVAKGNGSGSGAVEEPAESDCEQDGGAGAPLFSARDPGEELWGSVGRRTAVERWWSAPSLQCRSPVAMANWSGVSGGGQDHSLPRGAAWDPRTMV